MKYIRSGFMLILAIALGRAGIYVIRVTQPFFRPQTDLEWLFFAGFNLAWMLCLVFGVWLLYAAARNLQLPHLLSKLTRKPSREES